VPGGAGPLGWDLPASIGAKLAKPNNLVVDVTGDYGFGFCVEELAVSVHYNIPVVFIILNDGHLGLIRQAEKYQYDMHFAVDTWYKDRLPEFQQFVDYVKLAEAFGAMSERVEKPEDLKPAFKRAVEANHPYVVDVIMNRETDVSTGASIDAVVERS
jgi:tartronate-semialdehyde synthase